MADPLSLYVHIPFCTAKCGYCDFNSYAGQEHLMPSYADALVREAELWSRPAAGRPVTTVFFGGGTPSLTPLDTMAPIMDGLRAAFDVASDAETTLEANPGSIDEPYLCGLRDLGFDRLSIGAQSFHDDELRSLDRLHTADQTREAVVAARAGGFDNISLDLIFGLPEQPIERWQASVESALALEPEHLSLYALTVEQGTPLARDVERGRTPAPDPDAQADQYEWTCERMAAAGYEHYEISNWARPGLCCEHNLTYWRCREYLGLGAGAHSYFEGVRFADVDSPPRYIQLIEESWRDRDESGAGSFRQVVMGESITPKLAMADTLILGLRLNDGVARDDFRSRYGVDALEAFAEALQPSIDEGLLVATDDRLRLSERGRLLANEVFVRLLPD